MLQRKQTLFLLFSLISIIACLCLPVGRYVPDVMGENVTIFNLWVSNDGCRNFNVWPLFATLLILCPIEIYTIFAYNNRPLQSKMCLFGILLVLVWYVLYFFFVPYREIPNTHFAVSFGVCLPLLSGIFLLMARRGINHDEKLVRSADRIR